MRGILFVALLFAAPALAQTSSWQAKAKITSGSCADGAIVFVTEEPRKARLVFVLQGRPTGTPLDVDIGQDGGGFAERANAMYGPTTYQIFPGIGKRLIKSTTNDGKCSWTWQ
ncbi:hypothetical protein [uncultured Reyranella sp.]|uniref:hypothetical protein n=1 Tax=uncultured Reyranella sp. TaxID=735512 RepID=UPI0025F2FA52|nr:hypothetical protein [uncultured Reyranella sp.]